MNNDLPNHSQIRNWRKILSEKQFSTAADSVLREIARHHKEKFPSEDLANFIKGLPDAKLSQAFMALHGAEVPDYSDIPDKLRGSVRTQVSLGQRLREILLEKISAG